VKPAHDATRRGRRQLLLIASLFAVPVITAVVLYQSAAWRPSVNSQGTLVDPPRPLAAAGLRLADDRNVPATALQGRWSIVRPVTGDCGKRERALVEELARVRLALDKDADRVRRVIIHDGACAGVEFERGEPDLQVYGAPGSAGTRFLAQFPPAVDGATGLYIVDPFGNLMMSYPAAGSARSLLRDLERLLRLSRIG
jgi:hypothetical protein